MDDAAQVRDLNYHGDNIIVFTARLPQSYQARRPLEPINSQISTPRRLNEEKPVFKNEPMASPLHAAVSNLLPASTPSMSPMSSPQPMIMKREPRKKCLFDVRALLTIC